MSYDITLAVEAMGPDGPTQKCLWGVLDANYTYNVSPMLRLALGGDGINDLENALASDAAEKLQKGIARMEADPAAYQALNPSNGWGNYDGCLEWLRTIVEACDELPTLRLVVS